MKPKTAEEILNQTAELFDQDYTDEQIATVVDVYYKKVRAHLKSGKTIRVHLDKLGDLYVKKWSLAQLKEKVLGMLSTRYADPKNSKMYRTQERLQARLAKLNNLEKIFSEEDERRKAKQEERALYEQSK